MSLRQRLVGSLEPRALGALVILLAAIALLWDTALVYPIKILVVFFHELSHGLAAIATGGSIERIELSADQGGVCYTRGGSRFVTLTAGYLGSLLFGGALLVAAARTRWDRWISAALGALIMVIALLFIRPLLSFGLGFALLAGLSLLIMGWRLPEQVNDVTLRLIGLTSCLYAPLDIKSDILDRPHLRSDAVMLAQLTHIPSVVWGVMWIVIATLGALLFMAMAASAAPASSSSSSSSASPSRRS